LRKHQAAAQVQERSENDQVFESETSKIGRHEQALALAWKRGQMRKSIPFEPGAIAGSAIDIIIRHLLQQALDRDCCHSTSVRVQ
jgi:hypothetical protein